MGLAGGLSCLFAAIFPANPAAPVQLLRAFGLVALVGAGFIWLLGERMPLWGLQASMAGGTLGTSLLISQSATGLGMVVTACGYLWICVYAAFFFSRREARAQMALIAASFGLALLLSDNWVPVDAWIFMTASLLLASETIGRQSALLHREAHTDSLLRFTFREPTDIGRVEILAGRYDADKARALFTRPRIIELTASGVMPRYSAISA